MNQKGFSSLIIILGIVLIIGIAGGAYYFGKFQVQKSQSQPQNFVVTPQASQPTFTSNQTNKPTKTPNKSVWINDQGSFGNPPAVFLDNGDYPTNPTMVAQNFYNWYVSCLNLHFWNVNSNSSYPTKITPDQVCDYKKSRYASQELILTLTKFDQDFTKKCGNSEGCDHGDLILCAQNTPESTEANPASINGNTANLTVNSFGADRINVNLKLIDSKWKITNISCIQQ